MTGIHWRGTPSSRTRTKPRPTTVTMAPAVMRCLPDRSTTAEPPRCEMMRRAHLSPATGPSPDASPARAVSYPVVVTAAAPARPLRYHFSGIAGAGMNPLARLMRARGHTVQGSDRALDQGKSGELATLLRELGITLLPQDGAAVSPDLDRFTYSTAGAADTPGVGAGGAEGCERVPRPALLAEVVNAGRPGVAIAGTSGKSTITGMVTWLVRVAGAPATPLGGAALVGGGGGGRSL